jgi:hypothetical protein
MEEDKNEKLSKAGEDFIKFPETATKDLYSDTTESFIKMISWGLAISAGTLLWVMGSFEKFMTNICPDTCNSFIPSKYYFIAASLLILISTICFAAILDLAFSLFRSYSYPNTPEDHYYYNRPY